MMLIVVVCCELIFVLKSDGWMEIQKWMVKKIEKEPVEMNVRTNE